MEYYPYSTSRRPFLSKTTKLYKRDYFTLDVDNGILNGWRTSDTEPLMLTTSVYQTRG